jgi:hypothetical protein
LKEQGSVFQNQNKVTRIFIIICKDNTSTTSPYLQMHMKILTGTHYRILKEGKTTCRHRITLKTGSAVTLNNA